MWVFMLAPMAPMVTSDDVLRSLTSEPRTWAKNLRSMHVLMRSTTYERCRWPTVNITECAPQVIRHLTDVKCGILALLRVSWQREQLAQQGHLSLAHSNMLLDNLPRSRGLGGRRGRLSCAGPLYDETWQLGLHTRQEVLQPL